MNALSYTFECPIHCFRPSLCLMSDQFEWKQRVHTRGRSNPLICVSRKEGGTHRALTSPIIHQWSANERGFCFCCHPLATPLSDCFSCASPNERRGTPSILPLLKFIEGNQYSPDNERLFGMIQSKRSVQRTHIRFLLINLLGISGGGGGGGRQPF